MSRRVNLIGYSSAPLYLPQTIAYMAVTGIPADGTITIYGVSGLSVWTAVNNFFITGVADGWLSQMMALYLYIGGTATTHKYNAVNPLDTDAAFRVTWAGTITHSATGVKGNGVNGWGDTHLIYSTSLSPYSSAIGYYNSLNDWAVDRMDIGASGGYLPIFAIFKSIALGNVFVGDGLDYGAHRIFRNIGSVTGLFDMSIESNVMQSLARNGVLLGSVNTVPQTQSNGPAVPIALMARRDNANPVQFSPATYNMHYIAKGLTIAQRLSFYNAIQALQVILNRPAI